MFAGTTRRALGLAIALGLQAAPSAAQPQLSVALHYQTDALLEGCPSREQFQASVSRQLGYDPFAEQAVRHVSASARAASNGIVGELLWRDADGTPRGERRLSADHRNCAQFARSLAFAIVVQLQLLATPKEPAPVAGPQPAQPEAPEVEFDVAPLVIEEPPSAGEQYAPAAWQWGAGLGASVALGLAPAPRPLGRAFVAVRRRMLSLELGAAAGLPATYRAAGEAGFRSSVAFVTFSPCAHRQSFAACGLVHVGQLAVRGVGLDDPRVSSGVLAQAGLRVALMQPFGPVVGSVRVDLLRIFERWSVLVDGATAWTAPNLTLLLGVDFAFTSVLDQ
jgi:hypothetical protein